VSNDFNLSSSDSDSFVKRENAQLLLPEQEQVVGDSSEVTHGSSQLPSGIPVDDMGVTMKPSWVK
jgi:hypothetical protein